MRTLGWIYLAGYALDAGMSVIATYMPGALPSRNFISTIIILSTIVAFVLACLGLLKPRKIFLVLSGYYFLMIGFGIVVGMLLAVQFSPQQLQALDVNPQFLTQQFPWFEPVNLALLVLWPCLAVYGLVAYSGANANVEPGGTVDTQ